MKVDARDWRPHRQPDLFYGFALAMIACGLAYSAATGGLWILLLWPALSFGIVSFSYFSGSTFLFGKRRDGSRNRRMAVLLGPYLLLVRSIWSMQVLLAPAASCNRVGDTLILSRRLRDHELPENVGIICDLTSEMADPQRMRRHQGYVCFPMLDANGMDAHDLASFVRSLQVPEKQCLLIHCANGYGRTGLVAAAWLLASDRAKSADEALSMLQAHRPGIRLRLRQRRILDEVERLLKTPAK